MPEVPAGNGNGERGVRKLIGSLLALFCVSLVGARGEGLDLANVRQAAEYSAWSRGASLLVIQHGRVIFEEYANGHTARETLKIYSGTKAFWNLAALAAVQDGLLRLDERVAATLPEWSADSRKSRVTVRMLLDFSSGLEPGTFLHGEGVRNRGASALALPMVAEPGRSFQYGPASLQVFHEVLERKLAQRGETPTKYLERRVLRPMGLDAQRYLQDRVGDPLLATGWVLTAREWSAMGRVALAGGAPVLRRGSLIPALGGSAANRAFALGWWNNRAAPGGREFDFEDMLERDWNRQSWSGAVICRAAPPDLLACIGSGYQRQYVVPSLGLIVVRQGLGGRFSDAQFLRTLFGK